MSEPASVPGWLEAVRSGVEAHLARFFERKREVAVALAPECLELVDAISALTLRGGKRMRPTVLAAAYRAVRPDGPLETTYGAGAALELLQSYLLIHDDWMDADEERRGGPTVHVALARRYRDPHLGAAAAVLAGDLACAYAGELLFQSPFPPGSVRAAHDAYWQLHQQVVLGQHLDLRGAQDTTLVQDLKTGSYTVRGPLLLGAALAGATAAQSEALQRFARPLGIAFQLRDDLLGTFGDPRSLGKATGNDLRRGKQTALVIEARRTIPPERRAPLDRVLGRADASPEEIDEATALLQTSGVRQRVEQGLAECLDQARTALREAPFAPDGTGCLAYLVGLLAERDR